MKAPKILLAGLLACSAAGVAEAQTTVLHITGSTAFRTAVHMAITNMLNTGFTYAYTGGTFTSANQAIFSGTAKTNSIPVIIKTSWSGSLAGIETVSQAYTPAYVTTFLTNTTSMSTGGTANAPTNYDGNVIPECCMSDGFQFDSQYPTPALVQQAVGVVSFTFVKNKAGLAYPALNNMTPLLAQALYTTGQQPLSLFTGNPSDTNIVYAIGRDPDSGTRKTAFLETGVQTYDAALYPTEVYQWQPLDGSGNVVTKANPATIVSQQYWPAETVDSIPFPTGDAGYYSGGDLSWALSSSSPFIYVSYLGLSDDATLTNNVSSSLANLNYNGVPYTHANAENGQYTYWTYEFLDYNQPNSSLAPSANQKAVADYLAKTIASEDLSGVGESLSSMKVGRYQEGGYVAPGIAAP